MTSQDNVVQVVMLDVLLPDFEAWLKRRGLLLGRIPLSDPEEIPTYCVAVSDVLMENYQESHGGQ